MAVVRRIFDAALREESLRSSARALTADGVPTPTGRNAARTASVVFRILTHPVYAGELAAYRYATERRPNGTKRIRLREAAEHIVLPVCAVVPLVTPDEHRAVLERLEANKLRAIRNNRDPEATLLRGGFARCGYCGASLSAKRRAEDGSHSYRCIGTATDRHGCPDFAIAAPLLDRGRWARVVEVLRDPANIAGEVARLGDQPASGSNLDALDRRISELVKRQAGAARLLSTLDDDEATAPLAHELRSLANQKRQLDGDRDRLLAQVKDAAYWAKRLADLSAWCARVAENPTRLSYDEKRLVLEALAVDVRVWRSDHEPRWRLGMSMPVHHPNVPAGSLPGL